MNTLDKIEAWARETYKPKQASWKRPALLVICLVILTACIFAGYMQINQNWTNNGIWLVIGLFGFLSILGVFISIKCKDFWVALVLGSH